MTPSTSLQTPIAHARNSAETPAAAQSRAIILLISGPAGSGKTTLCERLNAAYPDQTRRAITCTTRQPRPGERDGVDYRFLSLEDFEHRVAGGEFLEHAVVHGNRYGSLKSDTIALLEAGFDVLLNLDVQGAETVRNIARNDASLRDSLVTLFVLPPEGEAHINRLRLRATDSPEEIARRLRTAEEEVRYCPRYDHNFRSAGREEDFERIRDIYLNAKMHQPNSPLTVGTATGVPSEEGRYAARGVSASKSEVHAVVDKLDPGLFPGAFCKITEDFLTGDPARCNLTHSDGSGTKSLLAYLWWRETGDASVFRGIAQDSIVMNVDDLLCVGATKRVLLSSTINRNARAIPGAVLAELISGTEQFLQTLRDHGLDIRSGGGETADVGDLTPTLTVDSTATAVLDRAAVVDASRIRPGQQIVAIASAGTCAYEAGENSGIGSNGLTSARHELLCHHYAETYPETYDHATPAHLAYCGPYRLQDPLPGSTLSVGRALLSPTRTYTPFVLALLRELGPARVAGLVHCSGGALTKSLRFGTGVHFVKDNLHPVPPVFAAIQRASGTDAREMHKVYNMGQRLEVYCAPADTATVLAIATSLGLSARISGHVEPSRLPDSRNHITLKTAIGEVVQYP